MVKKVLDLTDQTDRSPWHGLLPQNVNSTLILLPMVVPVVFLSGFKVGFVATWGKLWDVLLHELRKPSTCREMWANFTQIGFGKLPAVWFLFSRRKRVFVCSRSFYVSLNKKVFLFQYKCCIETRFSRCSSQEFAGFTVIVWLQLSEYVDIT